MDGFPTFPPFYLPSFPASILPLSYISNPWVLKVDPHYVAQASLDPLPSASQTQRTDAHCQALLSSAFPHPGPHVTSEGVLVGALSSCCVGLQTIALLQTVVQLSSSYTSMKYLNAGALRAQKLTLSEIQLPE